MNPAPSVGSFGRFQLKRIAEWVTRHDLDGVFLDFYGDTTMVDESRTRGQFPFWSMQDAEVEFAKAIAEWAHARQKYLIINCPQASMAVQHIADLVTVRRLPMPKLYPKAFAVSLTEYICTGAVRLDGHPRPLVDGRPADVAGVRQAPHPPAPARPTGELRSLAAERTALDLLRRDPMPLAGRQLRYSPAHQPR